MGSESWYVTVQTTVHWTRLQMSSPIKQSTTTTTTTKHTDKSWPERRATGLAADVPKKEEETRKKKRSRRSIWYVCLYEHLIFFNFSDSVQHISLTFILSPCTITKEYRNQRGVYEYEIDPRQPCLCVDKRRDNISEYFLNVSYIKFFI